MTIITTPRLNLRTWQDSDITAFRRLNADARVMEFFPHPLDAAESDEFLAAIRQRMLEQGFGMWAVELKADCRFIGFTGLNIPRFETAFTPCVEIGWRFLPEAWGHGYATEAARAVLEYAFSTLGLAEIVSFTALPNIRSQKVMERLGMKRDSEFNHPKIEPGSWLERHILYRLKKEDLPPAP